MILTTIEAFLIAAGPSLTAILGILIAVGTILKKFSTLIKEVKANVENKALREELIKSLKESEELKKQQKILIEQLTKVRYDDIK